MATTKTFQGKPKPAGKSGHFYESQRHALQAKGIKTGNLSDKMVFRKFSLLNKSESTKYPELKRILARIPTPARRATFLEQFNRLTENDKRFVVTILKDTDKDKAIDLFDCNPYNPDEQDLKSFIQDAGEKIKEGAQWVGDEVKKGAEWVKKEIPIIKEKAGQAKDWVEKEVEVVKEKLAERKDAGMTTESAPDSEDITYTETSPNEFSTQEYEVEAEPTSTYSTDNLETQEQEVETQPTKQVRRAKTMQEGREEEARHIQKARRQQALKAVGEEDEDSEESDIETEFETPQAKFGKLLTDVLGDYSEADFDDLSSKELEILATRYEARTKDSFFKPPNPFLIALKSRIVAQENVKLQKQKIDAELEPTRQQIKKEIAEIKQRAKEGDKRDWMEKLVGF